MTGGVKNVNSKSELDDAVKRGISVLHFWASWCEPSRAMEPVLAQLAVDAPQAHFFRVEAEEQPEISDTYDVGAVPYFLFLKDGVVVDKIQGANAPELANKVAKWAGPNTSVTEASPASLGFAAGSNVIEAVKKDLAPHSHSPPGKSAGIETLPEIEKGELHKLVNSNPIMLFMKGTPEEPRCGFSRKVVDALVSEGLEFGSFDILKDDIVRQDLKSYSNWPTYPQLYVKGELLGGCDIVLEMKESGELREILEEKEVLPSDSKHYSYQAARDVVVEPAVAPTEPVVSAPTEESAGGNSILARLEQLVQEQPIMLFMKGNPNEPRCGFSRKVVEALKAEGVEYGSFDILSDEAVRQGLKEYSNWPTYPQLYAKGEFIGGCDIVLEMHKNGELNEVLAEKGLQPVEESLESRIRKLTRSNQTLLFMKGTPEEPRCGLSYKVVRALWDAGISFATYNVLEDEKGIKAFSNWLTFPQLYHKGELVGGCETVLQLQARGELASTLSDPESCC